MNDFYYLPEAITAKRNFEANNVLKYEELLSKITSSIASENIIGAKVTDRCSKNLIIDFGHDIKGILKKDDCDISRTNHFMNRAIGLYVNIVVSGYDNESGNFIVSRKKVIYKAQQFHIENKSANIITKGIVTAIYENGIEVDILAGNVGNLHISNVVGHYIRFISDYFFIGQEANFRVEKFDKAYNEFELNYINVRQPNGIKTHSVIEAEIVEKFENEKKALCVFPDYNNIKGVIIGIPTGFNVQAGMKIPVTVTTIKQGMPIAKF